MVGKEDVLRKHRQHRGKIMVTGSVAVRTKEQLSTYYTPGVAYACDAIKRDRDAVYDYTLKGRTVAIVTDGTRILGLGDIGPEAGLPVMEGKALLFKKFGGVDAFPVCLSSQDEDRIVETITAIAPSFGAINIEDIETPKVFRIVERLRKSMDIPIFHDDRNGVATVILAALMNSLKLAGKRLSAARIVINGTGAAGAGTAELLHYAGARNVLMVDTAGILYKGRRSDMNPMKVHLASITNPGKMSGRLEDAASGADVLIGLSVKGAFTKSLIRKMAAKPIVFALANPDPEIGYESARESGAFIVATGRSDRPNQVNNLLAFPGILRGLLEVRAKGIDEYMLFKAAMAIARFDGKRVSTRRILPDPTESRTVRMLAADVAAEIAIAASKRGYARIKVSGADVRKSVSSSIMEYDGLERFISNGK